MKKLISKAMITFTAMALAIGSFAAPAQAASTKSKAFKCYKKYLSQKELKAEYGKGLYDEKYPSKGAYFSVAYIDNNDTPELLVKYTKDGDGGGVANAAQVRTYKNGKSYMVATFADYKRAARVYKKKGILRSYQTDGVGGYFDFHYQFAKGSTKIAKLRAAGYYDGESKQKVYAIKGSDDYVSAKAYKAYVKKLTKGAKGTKIVWHKNTKANRAKYLK